MTLSSRSSLSINSDSPEKKILIIGASWVGDMVMAQSLFIVLKKQAPNSRLDVLAPPWSRPILERMPEVNHTIEMPVGHGRFAWSERKALGQSLRQIGYDQAIVLPNSWKSALVPWFAGIPLRTGWLGEARYGLLNDPRKLKKSALPLMVQRLVALAYAPEDAYKSHKSDIDQCPSPLLVVNKQNAERLLGKYDLTDDLPVLVLCPGAEFGPAKQWPAAHYAVLVEKMVEQGWQVWLMGSAGDVEIAEQIVQKAGEGPAIYNLCGQTSLEEAIDLMSVADQVVSNDSGLMHIASALDKPLVALYGATSPQFTPPLSITAQVLSIDVECAPCFKRECPLGHHRCMRDLQPGQVLQALVRHK